MIITVETTTDRSSGASTTASVTDATASGSARVRYAFFVFRIPGPQSSLWGGMVIFRPNYFTVPDTV